MLIPLGCWWPQAWDLQDSLSENKNPYQSRSKHSVAQSEMLHGRHPQNDPGWSLPFSAFSPLGFLCLCEIKIVFLELLDSGSDSLWLTTWRQLLPKQITNGERNIICVYFSHNCSHNIHKEVPDTALTVVPVRQTGVSHFSRDDLFLTHFYFYIKA